LAHVIKKEDGCVDQSPHFDYLYCVHYSSNADADDTPDDDDELFSNSNVFASIIVSLDNETNAKDI